MKDLCDAFSDTSTLKESISFLSQDTYFDSCVSIVNYDMFSPTRARKLTKNEEIKSFVDLKHFGNISSIRDSQGEVFFCDLSIQVLKPKCFEDMDNGSQPFQWHGNKIKGIKTDAARMLNIVIMCIFPNKTKGLLFIIFPHFRTIKSNYSYFL